MAFKRYDGFVFNLTQKTIDNKLPICPFCGAYPHWLIESHTGLIQNTIRYQCEKCSAILEMVTASPLTENNLTIVHIGTVNKSNLHAGQMFNIYYLAEAAETILSTAQANNASTSEQSEKAESEHVVHSDYSAYHRRMQADKTTKHNRMMIGIIGLIASLMVVLAMFWAFGVFDVFKSPTDNDSSTSLSTSSSKLNYNNYSRIQIGMTYSEVCNILGSSGVLSSEAGYDGYSAKLYTWEDGSAFSYKCIVIYFDNGVVSAKSQVGL